MKTYDKPLLTFEDVEDCFLAYIEEDFLTVIESDEKGKCIIQGIGGFQIPLHRLMELYPDNRTEIFSTFSADDRRIVILRITK
ncbi:MAG: hypothetical protein EOO06_00295 [Chitinophagaceae bacterium]|nr:MAG: hypothetical protein EOO06_00295 [Chitinophagaceae bacterium]